MWKQKQRQQTQEWWGIQALGLGLASDSWLTPEYRLAWKLALVHLRAVYSTQRTHTHTHTHTKQTTTKSGSVSQQQQSLVFVRVSHRQWECGGACFAATCVHFEAEWRCERRRARRGVGASHRRGGGRAGGSGASGDGGWRAQQSTADQSWPVCEHWIVSAYLSIVGIQCVHSKLSNSLSPALPKPNRTT